MIDQIIVTNSKEAMIIFTNKNPVALYSSEGRIQEMLDEFLTPLNSRCKTLTAHQALVKRCSEDTQIIDLNQVVGAPYHLFLS